MGACKWSQFDTYSDRLSPRYLAYLPTTISSLSPLRDWTGSVSFWNATHSCKTQHLARQPGSVYWWLIQCWGWEVKSVSIALREDMTDNPKNRSPSESHGTFLSSLRMVWDGSASRDWECEEIEFWYLNVPSQPWEVRRSELYVGNWREYLSIFDRESDARVDPVIYSKWYQLSNTFQGM